MHISVKALFSLEDGVDATEKASGQLAGLSHYIPKSPHVGPGFCLQVEMLPLISAQGML